MHQIKITKKDGQELIYDLTPSVRVAFESHFKAGWRKRLVEFQMDSDLWYLAWLCESKAGKTTSEFGDAYIDQFEDIDIILDAKNG